MIKINRDFLGLSENHREQILKAFKIDNKLTGKIRNTKNAENEFYQYLKNNINDILEKDIEYLKTTIVKKIDKILTKISNAKRKKLNKDVSKIFNYTLFRKSQTKSYNAYNLLEELNINVCPYCNRQYINTVKPSNKQGGTRATLDHFLLKSDYPYLALSFWNLVPSCYSCNSQLRGTRDVGLHPYLKGFEKILHFYTDINDITEFIGNSKKYFDLTLKKYKDIEPDPDDYSNAMKNEKVFRLNDIYQNHKDHVREIIQKAIIYSKYYSKDLYSNFQGIFANEEEARNMVFSIYADTESLEKRPLAKLTKDIATELKILYET